MLHSHDEQPAVSRRDVLLGSAAGLALAVPGIWYLSQKGWSRGKHAAAESAAAPPSGKRTDPMPGLYPGRVVEVHHPEAVSEANAINARAVDQMVDRGMTELTGAEPGDVKAAWGALFEKGDVVGIKVNPVGRKALPGEARRLPRAVGSISSPEVLLKIIRCLKEAGIPPHDIVIFERYAREFVEAGYAKVMLERDMDGVRWCASAVEYTDDQLDITGFDRGRDRCPSDQAPHVVGYDPDVFTTMGFACKQHSPRDDRRFRSHLSVIVSRMINKMITIPVLKDHRSAGVTLSLKNMSHGMNNNVARSHLVGVGPGSGSGDFPNGPNQCNTFIPQAVSQPILRQRATLHILDGLIGTYEGGPGCWNQTWATWRHKGLFFATDPVALDHVGWQVIDAQRVKMGWPPVALMGLLQQSPPLTVRTFLSVLGASTPAEALALQVVARNAHDGRASEVLNIRQPEHVSLAGVLGLGVFDRQQIWHRQVTC